MSKDIKKASLFRLAGYKTPQLIRHCIDSC